MPTVWIPSLMQKLTSGQSQVQVEGNTIREVVDALEAAYPGFKERLCEDGRIRPALAVAVDGEISNEGMRRKVSAQSEVHFCRRSVVVPGRRMRTSFTPPSVPLGWFRLCAWSS